MPNNTGGKKFKKLKRSQKKGDSEELKELYMTKNNPNFEGCEYGIVTKILGGGRVYCKILLTDQARKFKEDREIEENFDDPILQYETKELLCRISGKLKKNKARIVTDSIVIIGTRDYQPNKADIIYVYNDIRNISRLKKEGEIPQNYKLYNNILESNEDNLDFDWKHSDNEEDNDEDDQDDDDDNPFEPGNTPRKNKKTFDFNDDDDIDEI